MKKKLKQLLMVFLRKKLGGLGANSYLNPFGTYLYPNKICVGDNVFIGARAIISASEGISIGNGVTIGPEFIVMGGDHNFKRTGARIHSAKRGG